MKKLLLVLFVFCIAGFSAFAGGEQETGMTGEAVEGMPEQLELTKTYFFGADLGRNQDQRDEWVAYMSERFGTQFKVNAFPRPEYMSKFALSMNAGDIKGMGWIFGGNYMEQYAADGASMVIQDEWLENNATWQSFPEGMREYNVRDGKLLAFPSGYDQGQPYLRAIRMDWLKNLGMEKPETVYEFYDVIKAFTENDPDGDGKDNTTGMTGSGLWTTGDIMYSFGVPVNHVMSHMIVVNPHEDFAWVDGLLKENAKDALQWYRDAYENGYLDQEIFTNGGSEMRDRMYSGYYGSIWYNASYCLPGGTWENRIQRNFNEDEVDVEIEPILGLTSDYADKWVLAGGDHGTGAPWILINGTKEPAKVANAFINIFYGDEVGYWSGRYGVYEKYWKFGPNGEIFRIAKDKSDPEKCKYYHGPGISIDVDPLGLSLAEYGYNLECWTDEQRETWNAKQQLLVEWTNEALEEDLWYQYSPLLKEPIASEAYLDIQADINRYFDEAIAGAITGSKTIDQAIADYRDGMRALGAQAVLEEANAAIGKPTTQQY